MLTKKSMSAYIVSAIIVFASILTAIGSSNIVHLASTTVVQGPIVIVDPGHGGVDGGASSADGLLEKDVNLTIALKLRDFLRINGYTVIMTRESDMSIHDDSAKTIRQKKVSDMNNRLNIIKSLPGSIFISIHQNSFPQSQYSGTQVFYSKNNPDSEKLAEVVKTGIDGFIKPKKSRKIKPIGKTSFLMNQTTETSILIECGFLSNSEDVRLIQDNAYQGKLALSTLYGLVFYSTDNLGIIKTG